MAALSETLVLVTGGSGFVASRCIIDLLCAGYTVRTTIRSSSNSLAIQEILRSSESVETTSLSRLSFVVADLTKDEGWPKAVTGCTYILHVASPFPPGSPRHENDLIIPARDGSLRVLRAAKAAGVKRVVMTSSLAAVSDGHAQQAAPFTERSWANVASPVVSPYAKSKALAERAAWDFVKSPEGAGLELSVINPAAIFGPILSEDTSTSILIIQRLLNGDLLGCPNLIFGIVDVRDVSALHLLAMTNPAAAGERFIAISPKSMTMQEIALALKARLPKLTAKTPTRTIPNLFVRFMALFDKEVASVTHQLGRWQDATNEKATRVLGWKPRSREDAIVATAESLVKLGVVKL